MVSEDTDRATVAAVILAAGGSTRMGQTKQLLPVEHKPLIRHVAETVCSLNLGQVVVVTGAEAAGVRRALEGLAVDVSVNQRWAEGLSTSLQAGVSSLRPGIRAVLLVLGDQPGLTAGMLETLLQRYLAKRSPIVAPFYQGQRGNPVLFDRAFFAELLAVEGDQGARQVIGRHLDQVEQVEVDDPGVFLDLDTPEDYARWRHRQQNEQ
jgi:molybdenum cofactor cytidylyltransferase